MQRPLHQGNLAMITGRGEPVRENQLWLKVSYERMLLGEKNRSENQRSCYLHGGIRNSWFVEKAVFLEMGKSYKLQERFFFLRLLQGIIGDFLIATIGISSFGREEGNFHPPSL